jgi:hypothetical protein
VLLSGKSAGKSYVVQNRLADGWTRRVTLAPTNVVDPDDARAMARRMLAEFLLGSRPQGRAPEGGAAGRDPASDVGSIPGGPEDLKPKSVADYRAVVERHLRPWLDLPLREISPGMVILLSALPARPARRQLPGMARREFLEHWQPRYSPAAICPRIHRSPIRSRHWAPVRPSRP